MSAPHPTRDPRRLHRARYPLIALAACALLATDASGADDDLDELFRTARPATSPATPPGAPAPLSTPDQPPHAAALPTHRPPPDARNATLRLSTGATLAGPVWTTPATPLRLWIEQDKTYRDIDLALLQKIDVHVLSQTMEDDWRWLKEGSDQKVYSGKKYPNVDLAYRFTLANGQTLEGTVVAPIYLLEQSPSAPPRLRTLALYKKYKGPLGSPMKDLVYIQSLTFTTPPSPLTPPTTQPTTHLPLLPD
jgi:hypothetical protein